MTRCLQRMSEKAEPGRLGHVFASIKFRERWKTEKIVEAGESEEINFGLLGQRAWEKK